GAECASHESGEPRSTSREIAQSVEPPDILSGAPTGPIDIALSAGAATPRKRRQVRRTNLVPLAGLEPARCFHHLILSQARLPIPPQGLVRDHSGEVQGVNGPIPLPPSHGYMCRGSVGTAP